MTGRVWTALLAVEKQLTTDRRYIERVTWEDLPLNLMGKPEGWLGDHESYTVAGHIIDVRREAVYIVGDVLFAAHEVGQGYERAADAACHHGGPPVWVAADVNIETEHIVASDGDGLWMDEARLLGATIAATEPAWPQCRIVKELTRD